MNLILDLSEMEVTDNPSQLEPGKFLNFSDMEVIDNLGQHDL